MPFVHVIVLDGMAADGACMFVRSGWCRRWLTDRYSSGGRRVAHQAKCSQDGTGVEFARLGARDVVCED